MAALPNTAEKGKPALTRWEKLTTSKEWKRAHQLKPITERIIILVGSIGGFALTILAIVLWFRNWGVQAPLILAIMAPIPGLGVAMGYHRMLTHNAFQAKPILKILLLIGGSMALEGSALEWPAVHIKHHAFSDRDGDPHSPLDGFFHAHFGWALYAKDANPEEWCPKRILEDHIILCVSSTYSLWVYTSLVIPAILGSLIIGGWLGAFQGLLWGGIVRIFLTHHFTASVNSVCHVIGKRDFNSRDQSHNVWWLSLVTFGEAWHNNHHAFPRSAIHGLRWWQFDLSKYVVWSFEKIGWIYDVNRPSRSHQQSYGTKHDTTEAKEGVEVPAGTSEE